MSSSGIFPRIQIDWDSQTNPERFEDSTNKSRSVWGNNSIHVDMFNDIDWTKDGHYSACISNAREVSDYETKFQRGHWLFLGPGDEEKQYGTYVYNPEGKWNQQAGQMIDVFAQSGHPAFRGTSAFNRGTLKRKAGRNTIHFTADSGTIELIMHSKSAQCLRSTESCKVRNLLEWICPCRKKMNSYRLDPQEVGSLAWSSPRTHAAAGNCWRQHSQRFEMMTPEEQLRTRTAFRMKVLGGPNRQRIQLWKRVGNPSLKICQ